MVHVSMPDTSAFFSTDPAWGALLDLNGDGVPDGVRAKLVLEGEPSDREWVELVHLCARLGLETTGIEFPLVISDAHVGAPGPLPVHFVPARSSSRPETGPGLWLHGADAVRELWQRGLDQPSVDPGQEPRPGHIAEPNDDLARLFEVGGLYGDRDDDLFPDGVAAVIVVPERLSVDMGAALCDFAARVGLETTGLHFPLAVTEADDRGEDAAVLLDVDGSADSDAAVSWERTTAARRALTVRGGAGGVTAALHGLARAWPCLDTWKTEEATATDLAEDFAAVLSAESVEGRAGLIAGAIETLAEEHRPGELRLLVGEPAVVAAAERAARAAGGMRMTLAPADRLALDLAWEAPWEVDRARGAFEVAVAKLEPGLPADLLVLVSEPDAVRATLAVEFAARLPPGSRVRVLSAYKAGLSWLREVVMPAWSNLDRLARVELRYQRFTAPEETTHLDLPIRWLQELFPGDELLAAGLGLDPAAMSIVEADGAQPATYAALAFDGSGTELAREEFSPRWYARPYLEAFPERGLVAASTGYLQLMQAGRALHEEQLPTDYDLFWDYYQGVVLPRMRAFIEDAEASAARDTRQPFFEALDVDVWASEPEERLGVREEALSPSEALHEDIYFATLDFISALGGQERLSSTLDFARASTAYDAPGAVRPWLHSEAGTAPRARIRLRAAVRHLAEFLPDSTGPDSVREPVAVLPCGPLPEVTIRTARWRAGRTGPAELSIVARGAGADAVAALRHIERLAVQAEPRLPIALELEGANSVSLLWPLPDGAAQREPGEKASGPVPLTEIVWQKDLEAWLDYLRGLPGVFAKRTGRSYGGRPLETLVAIAPPGPGVWSRIKLSLWKPTALFVARHHANEVASTPAALRLVELLASDPDYRPLLDRVNVVILPYENPDGAALHEELCREHPYWKHHAARFNAVGLEFSRDFFDPATRYGESRARPALWWAWRPDLVTDNHGIPSHEWVQLFSGFNSPPRFGVSYWLVQAHLYGILRYVADSPPHRAFAEALRNRVARDVAADECLSAAARPFRERYDTWGATRLPEKFPAEYVEGMLWFFQPRTTSPGSNLKQPPQYDRVTSANWVTEVADETARDEYLGGVAWGHLVANRAALGLLAEVAPPLERAVGRSQDGAWIILHRQRPLPVHSPPML